MTSEAENPRPTAVTLPEDVYTRLRNLDSALQQRQVLILPTETRGGVTHYLRDDIVAAQFARDAGLDAAYLVPPADRTYLEEYSAEWVLGLAMAVLQTMTVEVATGIAAYLWQRAKHVVEAGLHPGPAESVPMRLALARYERDSDGEVRIENLMIEGQPEGVEAAIRALVGRPAISHRPQTNVHEADDRVASRERDAIASAD